tara:strand:- start:131 stop:244 length:114 start_codon:yes stop_codon:yes gene_type:complete
VVKEVVELVLHMVRESKQPVKTVKGVVEVVLIMVVMV